MLARNVEERPLSPADHAHSPWNAPSFGQAVAQFVLAGLAAVAVFLLGSLLVLRELGQRKIWARDGRIVYSDEPRLIGSSYPLGADDLARPENRFERGQGDVYEVYTGVRTPNGTPLLFETYQRSSSLVASQENGATRLQVDDDGHGFTPVERDRRRAEGHVGLSLLEELAERMGGRLNIEAAPDNGTSFMLEVPST